MMISNMADAISQVVRHFECSSTQTIWRAAANASGDNATQQASRRRFVVIMTLFLRSVPAESDGFLGDRYPNSVCNKACDIHIS